MRLQLRRPIHAEVTSGENEGKTLTEYFVVRKFCDPIAATVPQNRAPS